MYIITIDEMKQISIVIGEFTDPLIPVARCGCPVYVTVSYQFII
jgi:hypothetical protein